MDQTNLALVVRRTTAELTGSLRDPVAGHAIPDVEIHASTSVNGQRYSTSGGTDQDGNFHLNVFDGPWQVSVDSQALTDAGFHQVDPQIITVTATRRSISR